MFYHFISNTLSYDVVNYRHSANVWINVLCWIQIPKEIAIWWSRCDNLCQPQMKTSINLALDSESQKPSSSSLSSLYEHSLCFASKPQNCYYYFLQFYPLWRHPLLLKAQGYTKDLLCHPLHSFPFTSILTVAFIAQYHLDIFLLVSFLNGFLLSQTERTFPFYLNKSVVKHYSGPFTLSANKGTNFRVNWFAQDILPFFLNPRPRLPLFYSLFLWV